MRSLAIRPPEQRYYLCDARPGEQGVSCVAALLNLAA
jgi:hypothetical protein